jgi:hypothetical protein
VRAAGQGARRLSVRELARSVIETVGRVLRRVTVCKKGAEVADRGVLGPENEEQEERELLWFERELESDRAKESEVKALQEADECLAKDLAQIRITAVVEDDELPVTISV